MNICQDAYNSTRLTGQNGAALVMVLLLGCVISMVALAAAYSARMDLRMAKNQFFNLQALYAADAGANHAFRLLVAAPSSFNTILANSGTGGSLAGLGTGSDVAIAGVNYRFRNFAGTGSGDGYYVRLADNFDETPDDPTHDVDGQVRIISRGRSAEAETVVEVLVKRPSGACMFSDTGVIMSGNSSVDSYNSSVGPYGGANVLSNANVFSNGTINNSGGYIHGNATAGVSIADLSPPRLTGSSLVGAPARTFPLPTAPCGGYSASGSVPSGAGISYSGGNLTVNSPGITFPPGNYCFGFFKLQGGATLTIPSTNATPVRIFIDNKGTFSGGSIANNTGIATNLQVYSTYSSTNSDAFVVSGGSGTILTIEAPETAVTISGGSGVFGSVIGKSITLSGGSSFHCDEVLGESNLQLVSWHAAN